MNRVIITGGGGDIARSIKKLLELHGYETYAPSRTEMDVTSFDSIEKNISAFKPDIIINNAGYLVPQSIKEGDLNRTKNHIDVNLGGTFYCSIVALKYNPNVEIINVCSAASIESHATWSEYCATKAGVAMATKCWAEDGIYAVAISPGRTRTKMRKSLYPDEDQNTLLEPDDFAKVVLKAINHGFTSGSNIIVRKGNVEEILREG